MDGVASVVKRLNSMRLRHAHTSPSPHMALPPSDGGLPLGALRHRHARLPPARRALRHRLAGRRESLCRARRRADARRAALAASANPVLKYLGRVVLPRSPARPRRPPGGGGAARAARRDDELNAADAGAHASLGGAAAGGEPRLPELRLEVRREESALRHLHLLARTEAEGRRVVEREVEDGGGDSGGAHSRFGLRQQAIRRATKHARASAPPTEPPTTVMNA